MVPEVDYARFHWHLYLWNFEIFGKKISPCISSLEHFLQFVVFDEDLVFRLARRLIHLGHLLTKSPILELEDLQYFRVCVLSRFDLELPNQNFEKSFSEYSAWCPVGDLPRLKWHVLGFSPKHPEQNRECQKSQVENGWSWAKPTVYK